MLFSKDHPLNQFPNWLSGDHWNRHLVQGSGIICGFEWQMEEDCTIRLCGGSGITSDGTLVCTEKKIYHFTHCQLFADAPQYPLFPLNDQSEVVRVWELLEGRPVGSGDDVTPLTPQNEKEEQELRLNEKVIVVFLDKRPDTSPPTEPQVYSSTQPEEAVEYGEQKYRIRFLMMDQEDVIQKLGLADRVRYAQQCRHEESGDHVYREDFDTEDEVVKEIDVYRAANQRIDFPEISLGRFGFGCLDAFDCEPEDLDQADFPGGTERNLDGLYARYTCIVDKATKDLDQAIDQLQSWLIDHFYCFENPQWKNSLELLCAKWEAYKSLNEISDLTKHKKEFVQYFYDWCRDLIKAYHELRDAVQCWLATCGADVTEHPCHLFVGLVKRESTYFPPAFRHHFQSPPSFHGAAKLKEEIRVYHHRLLLMIQSFYLPYAIPDASINPFCSLEEAGNITLLPQMSEVKVTPGRYYDQPLGKQSIPFYYPMPDDEDDEPSLHQFWDPARARNLTTQHHRSYHATPDEEGSYSTLPQVTHPLRFNIDEDDFIRVEGHIGQSLVSVRWALNRWRGKYNLAFDIREIKLKELTASFKIPAFGDVHTIPEEIWLFHHDLTGIEHLAGVRPNGTFVLVVDKANDVVVADFSLGYRCCSEKLIFPENGATAKLSQPTETNLISAPITTTPVTGATSEEVTITGVVQDKEGNLLPGASITTNLAGIASKVDIIEERFELKVPVGSNFKLKAEFTGFIPVEREVLSVTENANLGVIVLDSITDATPEEVPILLSLDQFNFDGQIAEEVFSEAGVVRESEAGQALLADFTQRFMDNTTALVADLNVVQPGNENREDLSIAINKLNANENDLNKVHRAYKLGMMALSKEAPLAPEGSLEALVSAEENLTRLYLDRVALTKPSQVTTGTLNTLKFSKDDLRSNIDLDQLTTEWSNEMEGKASSVLIDTFRNFQL